ncbi:MAG: Asp-tRNA(Asn)/Glu-tRNA(Gln) amidotransferase subunit GatA [Treponema sp.]|jgi:aspartyl-tRNA(Asn)/glutamyl-tRNA(Gln) amidotransferase subunit A|nr:Asp-tRNA(Asn)/Glu-tRNA(Gln) amidotransferase subunit GatA [Treponema sp.]
MGEYTEYFKKWEEKIGAFIEVDEEAIENSGFKRRGQDFRAGERVGEKSEKKSVSGLPFAVKDNIAVKGRSISCGSKLLENVKSPYTATAVKKLEAQGAWVIGKTNLDEFGMGSSTDNSALKKTNNPWDASRVAGGSSGGSAAAVAAGLVPFALGTDTGGSVRQPAAFCGVVGLKPTYGAVSRFGLVAYASSLETAGVLADSVERCRAVFSIIRGKDENDQTSVAAPANAPSPEEKSGKPRIIGVLPAESVAKAIAAAGGGADGEQTLSIAAQAATLEEETRRGFETAKKNLAALGHTLIDVEIPSLKYGVPAYYAIAAAEASANLARFDGIRYGKRPDWAENPDDLIDKAREAGFGSEVKLRILLGAFVLRSGFQDRYYLRAQRIRAGIRRSFEALLGDADYANGADSGACCDAVLLPVFPTRAFDRGPSTLSPFAQKAADLYTCCANLAGLPALSFPASVENGLPVGVQLLGRAFAESTLLDIAEGYEKERPFPHPSGYEPFWD